MCDLTPKKFGPFRWEISCGSMSRGGFWSSTEGELAALNTAMRQLGVGSQGGAETLATLYDEWAAGALIGPLARMESQREKLLWDDRVESSARSGGAASAQTHGSSSMETSKPLSRRARWASANAQRSRCRARRR